MTAKKVAKTPVKQAAPRTRAPRVVVKAENLAEPASTGTDTEADLHLPTSTPEASICGNMATFQLEVEYRSTTNNRNPVQVELERAFKDRGVQTAVVTLIVEDMGVYSQNLHADIEGEDFNIVAADNPLGSDTKFFVSQVVKRFIAASDFTVTVERVIVQQTPLQGLRFII